MSEESIHYGSRVSIRDGSELNGREGIVIKISETGMAEVLLDKEIIWPVKLKLLELVS